MVFMYMDYSDGLHGLRLSMRKGSWRSFYRMLFRVDPPGDIELQKNRRDRTMKNRTRTILLTAALIGAFIAGVVSVPSAAQAFTCERDVTANLVVIDQPLMYNRIGAANINGMIFALRRDVINTNSLLPLTAGGAAVPGQVELRPDRRPRPLALRIRKGDCLTVHLENLLTPLANPLHPPLDTAVTGVEFNVELDDQPKDRAVGFHAAGMQLVDDINDDGSMVGNNHLAPGASAANGSLIGPGQSRSYKVYAEKEGVFLVTSEGVTIGSDANEGHISNGLFGQVIVEPAGARIYRGQVHEEEMRLATTGTTADGHPVLDYEALYPGVQPWISEGKAGLPVLNM
ncbi:MAG: hypothetical protein C3F14_05370, partial [Deltaproteobacteria bacterium]